MTHPMDQDAAWRQLAAEIRQCLRCRDQLPLPPRPIFAGSPDAGLLIISQAPGIRAHNSGIPFDDASGNRLRDWLGLSKEVFYDARRVAIMPMGFCYPGSLESGDRPPLPLCAPTWHARLRRLMPLVRLTLLVGKSAQAGYLREDRSLTETVHAARACRADLIPIPHPSWHNNRWLAEHAWFERRMLPALRRRVAESVGLRRLPGGSPS